MAQSSDSPNDAHAANRFYFERFGFCPRQIATPPARDLGIAVVIPCFNEPDLIGSLEALWACERPGRAVEVIVVVNAPANAADTVRRQNQSTLEQAAQWTAHHPDPFLTVHLLDFPDLPPKHAGVGLARKIGMDEAVRRFGDIGQSAHGIVVCFDADCRCAPNFLVTVERHFRSHVECPGCSIYFEHPLAGDLDPKIYEAITAYELDLRYYVQALRFARFPYAHHTLGSCMAVRAGAYTKQGGMNKRQAGEDFYFLHKIIPLGGFSDLTGTTVFPSPRPSDRVPFGTGKAVRDYLHSTRRATYPLAAFSDLKKLFACLPAFYLDNGPASGTDLDALPESVRTFLQTQNFAGVRAEIRAHTASEPAFRKRFFHWFNGFQAMKFIHHARDHFYGERPLAEEAAKLLVLLDGGAPPAGERSISIVELLRTYRQLDRHLTSHMHWNPGPERAGPALSGP
jgi:hypothetical protein